MFNIHIAIYIATLFFLLTPGLFLRLPRKGSKLVVAFTHGVVFAVILFLTHKILLDFTGNSYDGFKDILAPVPLSPVINEKTPVRVLTPQQNLYTKQRREMKDLRRQQLEEYKKSINNGTKFNRQAMLDDINALKEKQKKEDAAVKEIVNKIENNALMKYKQGQKGTLEYLFKTDPLFNTLPEKYKQMYLKEAALKTKETELKEIEAGQKKLKEILTKTKDSLKTISIDLKTIAKQMESKSNKPYYETESLRQKKFDLEKKVKELDVLYKNTEKQYNLTDKKYLSEVAAYKKMKSGTIGI
jgi:hypothetical protein